MRKNGSPQSGLTLFWHENPARYPKGVSCPYRCSYVLNGDYQFRFPCYKIPNTLFGILIIWNACYLECLVFGILSYSTSFTKFHWFHSLPIYYRFLSVLRTINHFSFHQRTFNSSTLDQQSECQYCGTSSATFDDPVFEQPKFGNPVVSLYPGH